MSENVQTLSEILRTLSPRQLDFVAQRMSTMTDREAADATGISKQTVYGWANKADVNLAVKLAKVDGIEVGREKLRRLVIKAVGVLESEMGERKKRRLDAARDVLDRTGLEAVSGVKVTAEIRDSDGASDLLQETIEALEEYRESRT